MTFERGRFTCYPKQIYRIKIEVRNGEYEEKFGLVVSREELNRGNGCFTILFTTQKAVERGRKYNCVPFDAGKFGLTKQCVAKCDSIAYTIYEDFIDQYEVVGTIDDEHWQEVICRLGDVFHASCEINHDY